MRWQERLMQWCPREAEQIEVRLLTLVNFEVGDPRSGVHLVDMQNTQPSKQQW